MLRPPETQPSPRQVGVGLVFASSFRGFFLLAGLLAVVAVPAWVAIFTTNHAIPSRLGAVGWHAHEMIFGFTGAVLSGFLLTAARNWTGRSTLSGAPLGGLALLWGLGRAATWYSASLPAAAPLLIDLLFYLVVVASIARPIIATRSRRNFGICGLMAIIGLSDVATHLYALGLLPTWGARSFDTALDAITLILLIFAGRIIPMFTKKASGVAVRKSDARDSLGLTLMGLLALARALAPGTTPVYILGILAGVANAARLFGWGGARTLGKPILLVLHLGWFLLCTSFFLRGLFSLIHFAQPRAFLHLFTIGGIGITTFGMMSRVSLGHTGRPLGGARSIGAGIALLLVATATRVAAPMASPLHYTLLLWIAAVCWSLAFTIFVARYAPVLLSPRPDGKPG